MRKLLSECLVILIFIGICVQCSQQTPDELPKATQIAQTQTAQPIATMWSRLNVTSVARATNYALTPSPTPSPVPTIAYSPILLTERTFNDYTLRIYKYDPVYAGFEIWQNTTRVHAYADVQIFWLEPPDKKESELAHIAMGQDITGDGKANLVVTYWNGGAHCCTFFYIFEIAEQFKPIAVLHNGHTWIDRENFVNLDEDPALEFVTQDWTFAYWRTCFAASPAPKVILKYNNETYHLACDLMSQPMPSQDELASIVQEILTAPEWQAPMPPVLLWKTMLDLIYTGHASAAKQLLADAWPTTMPGKEKFWVEFLSELSNSRYWDDLLVCSPDLVPIP